MVQLKMSRTGLLLYYALDLGLQGSLVVMLSGDIYAVSGRYRPKYGDPTREGLLGPYIHKLDVP